MHVLELLRKERDAGGIFSVIAFYEEQVALRGWFWGSVVGLLCAMGLSTCIGMLILLIQAIVNGAS